MQPNPQGTFGATTQGTLFGGQGTTGGAKLFGQQQTLAQGTSQGMTG
jgi:hypothetical protein